MMISKLVMATNNAHKLREAMEIFGPLGIEIISQREAGADCSPEENGATFDDNALIKAEAVYNIVRLPVIADDSGLCVDALQGRPGVYSARYAPKGEECVRLLDEMKNVPDEKRQAHFACSIAYIDSEMRRFFNGCCTGMIGYEQRGKNGFGYDPVFIYGGRTLAEMKAEEKNNISHRAAALRELYEFLKERQGE